MQEYQQINSRCLGVNRRKKKQENLISQFAIIAAYAVFFQHGIRGTYMHSLLEFSLITTTRARHIGQFEISFVTWKDGKKKCTSTGRPLVGVIIKHRQNNNRNTNANLFNSVFAMSIRLAERKNVIFIIHKEVIR